MRIIAILVVIAFFALNHNLLGQNRKAHSYVFSNFNAFDANSGYIDEYGNAYIILYHNFYLPFNNDTIEALNTAGTSLTVCKIRPDGDLIWYSQVKGRVGDIDLLVHGDYLYCFGRFRDTIAWEGISLIESNPNDSLFDDDAFLVKFGLNGDLKYLRGFPDDLEFISNVTVKNNYVYYTGRFVNQIILGSDTLIEDSVSNQNGAWDEFLGKLDENGDPVFSTYLGSPSMQVIPDLIINDTSIISFGYFLATPSFAPTVISPSFIFMQFDTLGNLNNYRQLNNTAALPFMSLAYNSDLELITRDFSDSAENQIQANTIYGGQNHVGFYKYSFGAFSPPTNGIAYGGSTVELPNLVDDKFSFSGDLISNFISHPSGINYDGINPISSPYSIMAFNSETMNVEYFESVSGEMKEIAINQGFQLLTSILLDSVLTIDTLQIVTTPFVPEYLIYYTGDCDFFKPERTILQDGDSLYIDRDELEIEWYKNNGTAVPNSFNEESIRLVGAGTYYAELRNFFGCTSYSDTVNIVSGINENEYYSDVLVYPNPTTGKLHLDLNEPVQQDFQLKITDVNGRGIRSEKLSNQFNTLDISRLPTGLYFYELENESQRYRGKLIKQ